jgi:hypothetical protein
MARRKNGSEMPVLLISSIGLLGLAGFAAYRVSQDSKAAAARKLAAGGGGAKPSPGGPPGGRPPAAAPPGLTKPQISKTPAPPVGSETVGGQAPIYLYFYQDGSNEWTPVGWFYGDGKITPEIQVLSKLDAYVRGGVSGYFDAVDGSGKRRAGFNGRLDKDYPGIWFWNQHEPAHYMTEEEWRQGLAVRQFPKWASESHDPPHRHCRSAPCRPARLAPVRAAFPSIPR